MLLVRKGDKSGDWDEEEKYTHVIQSTPRHAVQHNVETQVTGSRRRSRVSSTPQMRYKEIPPKFQSSGSWEIPGILRLYTTLPFLAIGPLSRVEG